METYFSNCLLDFRVRLRGKCMYRTHSCSSLNVPVPYSPCIAVTPCTGYFQGMSFSLLGPTLVDLSHWSSSSLTQTSQLFTVRGGGTILGSFISALLFDHLNYYATYALFLFASALVQSLVCVARNYYALLANFFFSGVTLGFLDAGKNTVISRASAPLTW